MSRLYYSEDGHVVPTMCEEMTTFRRARKALHLPGTSAPGTLHLLARPYKGSDLPLRMSVNGREVAPVPPGNPAAYFWYRAEVDPALLRAGSNLFEFWTDATAMNAWSLAMEGGHATPESFVSDDGGKAWRNERMGYLNVQRGEYVVRVRLQEGEDPPPPRMVWEDAANLRLTHLRKLMPPVAVDEGPLMRRVRAISSWLSGSFEHTGSGRIGRAHV